MVCFQMQHAEIDFPRSEVYSQRIHAFLTFIVFVGHIQLHLIIKVHILEMTSRKLVLRHFQHLHNRHRAHTGEP